MADPLTALGLASNVVQFVASTNGLIGKPDGSYRTAEDDTLIRYPVLETITRSLVHLNDGIRFTVTRYREKEKEEVESRHQRVRQRLRAHSKPAEKPVETDEDRRARLHEDKLIEIEEHLSNLCSDCNNVAQELLGALSDLKSKSKDTEATWTTFRQALLTLWTEEDIDARTKVLQQCQDKLGQAVLESLQEFVRFNGITYHNFLDDLVARTEKDEKRFNERINELGGDENGQLQDPKKVDALKKQRDEVLEKHHFQKEILETFIQNGGGQEPTSFLTLLVATARKRRDENVQRQVLEKLRFHDMRSRYQEISEAHKETFEWTWSGDSELVIMGFFFWNSGEVMQMSKEGLLRALLYQAVEKRPHLIPELLPARWAYNTLFGPDDRHWTLPELERAFKSLVSDESRKYFIMIDGLDEYKGDPKLLTEFLLECGANDQHVKICVSSQPWDVFDTAFQSKPSLSLERLTEADIELYAREQLSGNDSFHKLQIEEPTKIDRLVHAIAQKADGSFLWVQIVTASLLEGFQEIHEHGAWATVQYIHKSVEEFLEKEDTRDSIQSGSAESDEDIKLALCTGYLRSLKKTAPSPAPPFERFQQLATQCLKFSGMIEKENGKKNLAILTQLDRAATCLLGQQNPEREQWRKRIQSCVPLVSNPHWTNACPQRTGSSTFFDFAFLAGFYSYVENALREGEQHQLSGLLATAVKDERIDAKFVRLLLDHGARPNEHGGGAAYKTPWYLLLSSMSAGIEVQSNLSHEERVRLGGMAQLFLAHDADPFVTVRGSAAEDIVAKAVGSADQELAGNVVAALEQSKKKNEHMKRKKSIIKKLKQFLKS
ncbi:hypothetical protein UCDDS831_g05597 [Diplodia seriata]|uniref:Nephrocystin 3-like N-terminal domain-containing protein n=1 Tax=Diplodia seriata TaxID=420778 RepID=A0A0G2GQ56_9PEZI|nr:hypothetical protein UCDDS831_g05597 [Diplodia seriata]